MAEELQQTNDTEFVISRDDFSKLLLMLKIFENHCTDCDIQNGLMRCRTNDRQSIISMDLTSIINENALTFSLIKNKLNILKTFELDDNVQVEDKNIMITINDSNYEFKDQFTKISFRKPIIKFLDNKFIKDDEFASMIQCNEESLVFSYDISNYIKKRISNNCLGHQTDIINCVISDMTGKFFIEPKNHEDKTDFINDIIINTNVGDKQFKVYVFPFTLDVQSDIKMSVYAKSSNIYLCKIDQKYYGIPITIYMQTKVFDL